MFFGRRGDPGDYGIPEHAVTSFRERWYKERGQAYDPPRLTAPAPWRCVGGSFAKLADKPLPEPVSSPEVRPYYWNQDC